MCNGRRELVEATAMAASETGGAEEKGTRDAREEESEPPVSCGGRPPTAGDCQSLQAVYMRDKSKPLYYYGCLYGGKKPTTKSSETLA